MDRWIWIRGSGSEDLCEIAKERSESMWSQDDWIYIKEEDDDACKTFLMAAAPWRRRTTCLAASAVFWAIQLSWSGSIRLRSTSPSSVLPSRGGPRRRRKKKKGQKNSCKGYAVCIVFTMHKLGQADGKHGTTAYDRSFAQSECQKKFAMERTIIVQCRQIITILGNVECAGMHRYIHLRN